jgi:hypothetical protein
MGVIISGFSSTSRDFSDAETTAIDAHDIALSEGNWREHLSELFFGEPHEADMPAERIEKAALDYVEWLSPMSDLNDWRKWHLTMARRVLELARATRANGGDMVGIAG